MRVLWPEGEIDVYYQEDGALQSLGSLNLGERVQEATLGDDRLLVRTGEPDGGCLYAWDLRVWREQTVEYGESAAATLAKTCLLPAGEGWHVSSWAVESGRMAWSVWDMMEQEDEYDRDVEVADFNPNTEHGFVTVLDLTVAKHGHGEEYSFIQELSKAHDFIEFEGDQANAEHA